MIKINTDAAYNPNTQETGIGIHIVHDNHRELIKIFVSEVTDNHIAEFIALIAAINYIQTNLDTNQIITYQSDSKIVIQSIEKQYVKNIEYKKLLDYILSIINEYPTFFASWIPEAQNRGADSLAKQALRKEGKLEKTITYSQLVLDKL